jgi:hypothetical protein
MDITKIEVMGKAIKAGEEMVSLTDLWKAYGDTNKRNHPSVWGRSAEAKALIDKCAESLKVDNSQLWKVSRGHEGGTFAHWQIALAYAKWLSPELHLQVNDIYRRFQEADPAIAESVIDRTENAADLARIEARARNKQTNKALNGVIAAHGGEGKTFARVADINNIAVTGKTAKQIRAENGLPKKASTRPILPTNSMIHMAFLEDLEAKSIEKKRSLGHSAIVANACDVANSLQAFVAQYA